MLVIFLGYGIGRKVLRLRGIFMERQRFSKANEKENIFWTEIKHYIFPTNIEAYLEA